MRPTSTTQPSSDYALRTLRRVAQLHSARRASSTVVASGVGAASKQQTLVAPVAKTAGTGDRGCDAKQPGPQGHSGALLRPHAAPTMCIGHAFGVGGFSQQDIGASQPSAQQLMQSQQMMQSQQLPPDTTIPSWDLFAQHGSQGREQESTVPGLPGLEFQLSQPQKGAWGVEPCASLSTQTPSNLGPSGNLELSQSASQCMSQPIWPASQCSSQTSGPPPPPPPVQQVPVIPTPLIAAPPQAQALAAPSAPAPSPSVDTGVFHVQGAHSQADMAQARATPAVAMPAQSSATFVVPRPSTAEASTGQQGVARAAAAFVAALTNAMGAAPQGLPDVHGLPELQMSPQKRRRLRSKCPDPWARSSTPHRWESPPWESSPSTRRVETAQQSYDVFDEEFTRVSTLAKVSTTRSLSDLERELHISASEYLSKARTVSEDAEEVLSLVSEYREARKDSDMVLHEICQIVEGALAAAGTASHSGFSLLQQRALAGSSIGPDHVESTSDLARRIPLTVGSLGARRRRRIDGLTTGQLHTVP